MENKTNMSAMGEMKFTIILQTFLSSGGTLADLFVEEGEQLNKPLENDELQALLREGLKSENGEVIEPSEVPWNVLAPRKGRLFTAFSFTLQTRYLASGMIDLLGQEKEITA